MYFNTMDRLRQQMYGCFERSRDALFNLSDALEGVDEHGKRVVASCWNGLHFREAPLVEVCACNQLLLAQHLGQAVLRPWESKERAVTPRQVRSRHAQHFVAGWHTSQASQTTWKIARMAHRSGQNTRATLCGGAQTQTGAKNAP